ncbi:MFS transporter [Actinacidiphila bryophytorum]|uniref:MFS transporter n=1 Tax=Actinacidiphila bryophytorum TaxID=1436133 RepID=A0A9W4ED95_9ACTN|nr:MFS transporter [Actinacidiphila bryophytorum]MBM9438018.1 MFS transporter [Actinacidiphila bryophytorum]MBN6541679.1 MFS transporter [Actinacidiphila bryophytorum]CAG7617950.1 MFS transporter [Actinacidiphila bryophytorum]
MATTTAVRPRALVRASGGPRYAVAVAVDALGTGMLRPFLLLYGVTVLGLSAPVAGTAMTAGAVAGLVCMPGVGRRLDRGERSTVVAASMLVRVLGVALLLATPDGDVWSFAAAALFLGVGNQAQPAAHAALVATVAHGRERDAALAAARAVRNAGMGAGALLATVCLAGGTTALRALALGTVLAYLAAAALAWSVHVHAGPAAAAAEDGHGGSAPGMRALIAANVVYVFCLNVPEVALPLVLVTQMHASPMWPAAVLVANTVLVITLQVPVTVALSRFSRRSVLAAAGVVLTASYAGFLAATSLGPGWGAPAVAAVAVVCTLGEIVYAGSATALVTALAPAHLLGRTLARFQLSTGLGLAASPAAITALAPHGPTALWGSLAAATLLSASAVARNPEPARP